RLLAQVLHGEAPLGLPPAHPAAGAVGGALEAVRVPQSTDDERPGAHRPGDDPEVALAGPDRALARDQYFLAEMDLLGHIVVVAMHRVGEAHIGPKPLQDLLIELHH